MVAVAIFDNETGDLAFDRLATTAADIMVERLTALGTQRIGVIGNTPALRESRQQRDPEAVRRETGAGYFVFGQVQHDDAGVRLVVHLIRLDDATHLWVTRVARAPADLADIQDVVADRLAEAVRRHVIENDPSPLSSRDNVRISNGLPPETPRAVSSVASSGLFDHN